MGALIISKDKLESWVFKSQKLAIYEAVFGFFVLGLFSFLMYQKSNGNLIWFLIGFIGLLFFTGIYTYGGTVRRGRIINRTVKSLSLDENVLKFTTFSYNILGLKKIPEMEIEIKRDSLVVKRCDYPIKDNNSIQGKILSISDKNQEKYFILPQYFSEEIREIIVEEN